MSNEARDRLGSFAEALRTALERLVANAVPPDALMNPALDGPGSNARQGLYDWWHQRCAPALQQARALIHPRSAETRTTTAAEQLERLLDDHAAEVRGATLSEIRATLDDFLGHALDD